MKAGEEISQNL